jgi:hypothetical protein
MVSHISIDTWQTLIEFDQIKEATVQHFHQLYSKPDEDIYDGVEEMLEHIPHSITSRENEELLKKVIEEQIARVV